MPRGLPDYYNPDTLVSQRLANVEEVVTAVQRIASLDNRGRTLWFENFSANLAGWKKTKGGDGVLGVISTAQSYISPASAFLDAGTSGGNGSSQIVKRVHLGASTILGLETSFLYYSSSSIVRLHIQYSTSDNVHDAYLEILPASGVIRVWDVDAWVTVGNVDYNATSVGAWLPVKLVVDFANLQFKRAIVGQEEITLTDYTPAPSALEYPGQAYYGIVAIAAGAVTNDAYVGYAAGTVDEP